MSVRQKIPAVLFLLAVVAAGCSSVEDDTTAAAEGATTAATAPPVEETTAAASPTTETTATAEATPTDEVTATAEATPTGTSAPSGGAETTIATEEHEEFGPILVDGEGRSLYLFTNDTGPESTCYDQCAEAWPALTGEAGAEGEADEGLLGTTERDDGETQVTYADHPLYYFAADEAPGDTNGQGVGGVWFLVDPRGEPVEGDGGGATEGASTEETSSAGLDY